MDERQSLETLSREEKTAARTLSQLTEKEKDYLERKEARKEELEAQTAKSREVRLFLLPTLRA